jgi:hypothetical protein
MFAPSARINQRTMTFGVPLAYHVDSTGVLDLQPAKKLKKNRPLIGEKAQSRSANNLSA